MRSAVRLAVSGATGRVARSLLPRIVSGEMFGPDRRVELSLLDIPEALPVLKGLTRELKQSAPATLCEFECGDSPRRAFEGADWVILLGGLRCQPGMRGVDWGRSNGSIFMEQSRAINAVASNARIMVAAHPCNLHVQIARSHARDVPPDHWFALTRPAEECARDLIAEKIGVAPTEVNRLSVWGNDSPRIYVDLINAWVSGRPAAQRLDREWMYTAFEKALAKRVDDLIQTRADAPTIAARSIVETIRSLTTATPYRRWFNAGVVSDGSYGVPHGLVFGFPLRTEDGRDWSIVQDLYLDLHAQDRIDQNVAEMSLEAVDVGDLIV